MRLVLYVNQHTFLLKKKTRNKRNCLNLIEGICKKSSANITYNNEMLRHLPKN